MPFRITAANFREIVAGSGCWLINDLPPDRAAQLRPFLNNSDTFAVFASGDLPGRIGGIDWIRLESNPVLNEPPLNAYHFTIECADEQTYLVNGPYRDGALMPHWGDGPDLNNYGL
jgi:hypothetical protein